MHRALTRESNEVYRHAYEYNKWINYKGTWYTPKEFIKKYGEWSIKKEDVRVESPARVLDRGRKIINDMVAAQKPPEMILDALERLHAFTDKMRQDNQ